MLDKNKTSRGTETIYMYTLLLKIYIFMII